MRAAIHDVYSGKSWHNKVLNMSDAQVTAVYFSFLEKGKFDKKVSTPKKEEKPHFEPFIGEQLSLF